MRIAELKKYVDKAYKKGPNCDIEVSIVLDDGTSTFATIDRIGQFNIVPDMTLIIKPEGEKLLTSRKMTEEELDYKRKYENLNKKINKFIDDIFKEV